MGVSIFMLFFVILIIGLLAFVLVAKGRTTRYSEAGTGPDERTIAEFGNPVRSLYTSTAFLSLCHHIIITDAAGVPVYESSSKVFSFRDRTDVMRADGTHVAHIERKVFTLHQRHYVTMEDGTAFELWSELFHIIKDIINIDGLGWQIEGNILQMNFLIKDRNGNAVAYIGQKLFSIHDRYSVDIYQPQYEEAVVAILVCLQHMVRDREASSSAAYSSSSSSSASN